MKNIKQNSQKLREEEESKQNLRDKREEMNRQFLKLKIKQMRFVFNFRAHLGYLNALKSEVNMSLNVGSN